MVSVDQISLISNLILLFGCLALTWAVSRGGVGKSRLELVELEGMLRTLIKEADQASKELHDKLGARHQSIQKSLFEIDGAEQRINSAVNKAEDEKQKLDSLINKLNQLVRRPDANRQEHTRQQSSRPHSSERQRSGVTTLHDEISDSDWLTEEDASPAPNARREQQAKAQKYQPLRASIERQVLPNSRSASDWDEPQRRERQSEASADPMLASAALQQLKAGEGVRAVAARTGLAVEVVRRLALSITEEELNAQKISGSAIKRSAMEVRG